MSDPNLVRSLYLDMVIVARHQNSGRRHSVWWSRVLPPQGVWVFLIWRGDKVYHKDTGRQFSLCNVDYTRSGPPSQGGCIVWTQITLFRRRRERMQFRGTGKLRCTAESPKWKFCMHLNKSTRPFRKKTHGGRDPHHPGHCHNANVSRPKLLHLQTGDRGRSWPYPTMPHVDRNWMKEYARDTSNSGSNRSTLRGMMGSGMVMGHLYLEEFIMPYKITTWIQNRLLMSGRDGLIEDWITHCLTHKLAALLTDWQRLINTCLS